MAYAKEFQRFMHRLVLISSFFAICLHSQTSSAQSDQFLPLEDLSNNGSMTVDDLESIVARLDENYQRETGVIQFSYAQTEITIVTDETANRMRIIVPILSADLLDPQELYRLLQANFDSALDARYALAQGILWSTFMHPLSSLTEIDFLSGIGQTINSADSFGVTYSSGELIYGGGDSDAIHQRELIDQIQDQGRSI